MPGTPESEENQFQHMLCALHAEKAFPPPYNSGAQEVYEKQTHLSVVFLTSHYVYKIIDLSRET